jgi:hypothetical protein
MEANNQILLINRALSLLKTAPIVSLQEDTLKENNKLKTIQKWYSVSRDKALIDLNPFFARKSEILPYEEVSGYYFLPNDFLQLLKINDEKPLAQDFDILENKWLNMKKRSYGMITLYVGNETTKPDVEILYTSRIISQVPYDVFFQEYLVRLLAENMCMEFVNDPTYFQFISTEKTKAFSEARNFYARQSPAKLVNKNIMYNRQYIRQLRGGN